MTDAEQHFIERIYNENFEKLYFYAFSCVGNREIAEDLVIETFVCAVKKAPILLSHENPKGWLMEALKYEIKMYLRNVSRTPQMVPYDTVAEPSVSLPAIQENTEDDILYNTGLSDVEQQECRMYFLENLPHDRVAEELGITVSASQKRRERLRKKLKRKWGIFL